MADKPQGPGIEVLNYEILRDTMATCTTGVGGGTTRRVTGFSFSSKALMQDSSKRIIEIIRGIPRGHVLSYGAVARQAGLAHGARQVSRILHSSSERYDLPWHRIVNAQGRISLTGAAGELQRALLESEGIEFEPSGKLDLAKYL